MITRIEIDGFKSFQNFKVELGPFQVIVGQNGVGKSNLFDALRLLSLLADHDFRTAFQMMRGDSQELFTLLPNGKTVNTITFAVEIFIDPDVRDSWGGFRHLYYQRLRYELGIIIKKENSGLSRFVIEREALKVINAAKDNWTKRYKIRPIDQVESSKLQDIPSVFVEIYSEGETVSLESDQANQQKRIIARGKAERTLLSIVEDVSFPHALAVRQEMRNWRFLQLNSEILRQPVKMSAEDGYLLPDGSNLATVLARMENEDKFSLNDVYIDLANLVTGVVGVKIDKNEARQENMVQIEMQDGRTFSSRLLSDGTLRMLALATLRNDPQERGVLCLEEPENGVHPQQLRRLVKLLRDTATNLSDSEDEPLRQVLINTHSPVLVSQLINLDADQTENPVDVTKELLFAYTTTTPVAVGDEKRRIRITRMVPPRPDKKVRQELDIDEPEAFFTARQIVDYLNSGQIKEAETIFEKAVGL